MQLLFGPRERMAGIVRNGLDGRVIAFRVPLRVVVVRAASPSISKEKR